MENQTNQPKWTTRKKWGIAIMVVGAIVLVGYVLAMVFSRSPVV